MSKLRAIGITSGIGSMLVGARNAGFKIVGNVEWRPYYFSEDEEGRNTFRENFPGAIFKRRIEDLTGEELKAMTGADLALGHPECGSFSLLCGVNKSHSELRRKPMDIPLFVDLVARLKPRMFVMDDLPGSLVPFPMSEYARRLPDYDLFPEWVSNWGYGNVQRHRNRMFMLGSLRDERWAFIPGEEAQEGLTLRSVIGDLPKPAARGRKFKNHYPTAMDELAQKCIGFYDDDLDRAPTWRTFQKFMREHVREGESIPYMSKAGMMKNKPGCKIEYWESERGASVQDGGSYKIHPVRFDNLTIRERARIQGFPDDFVFYGARLNEAGEYQPTKNMVVVKQTGKAMPVQFCEYVSRQVSAHIRGVKFKTPDNRVLRSNPIVDEAKQWYCEQVGYADQRKACGACWLYDSCTIRMRRYQIGDPPKGQMDLFDPGIVPIPKGKINKIRTPSRREPPARQEESLF